MQSFPHGHPLRQLCRALLATFAVALLTTGCDRGTHPEQLGLAAPQFALHDSAASVDLAHERGHVVLLNFWASWCAPCLEEWPGLNALQAALPQVRVVGVSIDTDSDAYATFLARHPAQFLTVLDGHDRANSLYGTYRPPETFVIDRSGVIRRKFIGPQDWQSPEILGFLRKLAA